MACTPPPVKVSAAGGGAAAADAQELLRALYARAHRLVIASYSKSLAELEDELPNQKEGSISAWVRASSFKCIELLRIKIRDYQRQYDTAMRDDDFPIMSRFLDSVRAEYEGDPDFAPLFEGEKRDEK